jgi:cbb3-type cytochrome c oxidase subunit III
MNDAKLATLILAFIISSSVLAMSKPANRIPASPAADGSAVFAAKCALCHGKDGRGLPNWRAKGQPDFTDAMWQKSRTDAQLIGVTKEGKGKYMPAFKAKLSDEEITTVVARIRSFARK